MSPLAFWKRKKPAETSAQANSADVDDFLAESQSWSKDEILLPIPFRVLILGRANAGKTTILERITGSSEAEAWIFRDGKRLTDQGVKGQADRGLHNIKDEIRFPARPGFIFHDTRGFEAGSEVELEEVRQFVEASARVSDIRKQLHAIWMCLPLDEARDLFRSEKDVFGWKRGRIPLVVIFTKRDGAVTKFTKQIIAGAPDGTADRAFRREARRQAEGDVEKYTSQREKELRGLSLQDDSEDETLAFLTTSNMGDITESSTITCHNLINATEQALTGPSLQSSLCSAWGKNIEEIIYWLFLSLLHNGQVISEGQNWGPEIMKWLLDFIAAHIMSTKGVEWEEWIEEERYDDKETISTGNSATKLQVQLLLPQIEKIFHNGTKPSTVVQALSFVGLIMVLTLAVFKSNPDATGQQTQPKWLFALSDMITRKEKDIQTMMPSLTAKVAEVVRNAKQSQLSRRVGIVQGLKLEDREVIDLAGRLRDIVAESALT